MQALLAGESLSEYAGRAGLSRNTVKTQLDALFGKTETRRQSELIRQLSRLAAAFSREPISPLSSSALPDPKRPRE